MKGLPPPETLSFCLDLAHDGAIAETTRRDNAVCLTGCLVLPVYCAGQGQDEKN